MRQRVIIFLLGDVDKAVRGEVFEPPLPKSAPLYYRKALPPQVIIGKENVNVGGRDVTFHIGGYPPDVLLVRADVEVENVFHKDMFDLEGHLFEHARRILQNHGGNMEMVEEYSVFTVGEYEGKPEQFFEHAPLIAGLLKSERMELDPHEVEYTLRSQIKYGRNDLSIIDWDGAFLFDQGGHFEADIELLILANLQLLGHRALDSQLDKRLARVSKMVEKPFRRRTSFRSRAIARDLVEVVRIRMLSISELQRLDRDIKLIGDWYSARFFDLVTGKFKIDDWRKSILGKLDLLEDVYTVVENFAVSWKNRAEWIQISLFFVLQVLWFVLIYFEMRNMR